MEHHDSGNVTMAKAVDIVHCRILQEAKRLLDAAAPRGDRRDIKLDEFRRECSFVRLTWSEESSDDELRSLWYPLMLAVCRKAFTTLKDMLSLIPMDDTITSRVINLRCSSTGLTLLHFAVLAASSPQNYQTSLDILDLLIHYQADVSRNCVYMFPQLAGFKCRLFSPLWLATLLQQPSTVQVLIRCGASPYQRAHIVFPGFKEPPHSAVSAWQAAYGHLETCQVLFSPQDVPPSFAELCRIARYASNTAVEFMITVVRWDIEAVFCKETFDLLLECPESRRFLDVPYRTDEERICKEVFCSRLLFAACSHTSTALRQSSRYRPETREHIIFLEDLIRHGARVQGMSQQDAQSMSSTLNLLALQETQGKGFSPVPKISSRQEFKLNLPVTKSTRPSSSCVQIHVGSKAMQESRYVIGCGNQDANGVTQVAPLVVAPAWQLAVVNQSRAIQDVIVQLLRRRAKELDPAKLLAQHPVFSKLGVGIAVDD